MARGPYGSTTLCCPKNLFHSNAELGTAGDHKSGNPAAATMSDIQRADPIARKQAVLVVAIGTIIGTVLILGFERLQVPLREWILSEPGSSSQRVKVVFLIMAAVLLAPLLALAAYFWRLGRRIVRKQQFPPPMHRVIRDTPIIRGPAAVFRGRVLGSLAVCLAIAAGLLSLVLWWVAMLLSNPAVYNNMASDADAGD